MKIILSSVIKTTFQNGIADGQLYILYPNKD